jgi:zinc protease
LVKADRTFSDLELRESGTGRLAQAIPPTLGEIALKFHFRLLFLLPLVTAFIHPRASFPQGGQPSALPSAESILDRYIEVTGGRDAYGQIHNIVSLGRFEVNHGTMQGTLRAYEAEPDKSLTILQIEAGDRIEEGAIGDVAWARSSRSGAFIKMGEEKTVSLREARFNARVIWRTIYPKVECMGTEDVEGAKCFKVVLTPAAGRPITHFYDSSSGLLIKSLIILNGPSGYIPSENLYGDYRKSSGVLFPRRLTHRVPNEITVVQLESVACNTEIATGLFDLPPEVRSLVNRTASPAPGSKPDKP